MINIDTFTCTLGHVAQPVGHLTSKSGSWVRYPVWQHTFVSPSADSRGAVVSYWQKYVHEVLVNRLGGLSLPRKSVVRLTGSPDMTLDVYRGHKTTIQQHHLHVHLNLVITRSAGARQRTVLVNRTVLKRTSKKLTPSD